MGFIILISSDIGAARSRILYLYLDGWHSSLHFYGGWKGGGAILRNGIPVMRIYATTRHDSPYRRFAPVLFLSFISLLWSWQTLSVR